MRALLKVVSILLLVGAAWWWLGHSGVLPRIPSDQRAALDLLRAPEAALPGRDATIAAYLVSRGVPHDDWARFEAMDPLAAVTHLQAREPAPDPARDGFKECQAWGNGCLARVRADPPAAHALHASLATRLSLIDALERDHAHARQVGEWNFASPIPPFGGLHLPVRLEAALRFAEGDHAGGLQRLCEHARFWRGLRHHTDLLIVDMIGVAYLSGAANTYGEMLVALPEPLGPPAVCDEAFAPLRDDEFEQCRVYKTEFRGLHNTMRDRFDTLEGKEPTWLRRALVSAGMQLEPTLALSAPPYAAYCMAEHRERIAQRLDMAPVEAGRCGFDGWVFNPFGCIVGRLGASYADYYHRLLDLDGRLRLTASAAWLRSRAAADPATAFAQRPEALRDPRHALAGVRCAPVLRFDARKLRPQDSAWELPLAPPSECATSSAPTPTDDDSRGSAGSGT